jgi:SAM-dependent methyltransferase
MRLDRSTGGLRPARTHGRIEGVTRWDQVAGRGSADSYQACFDKLADAGHDVHGEATFCAGLLEPGARVLDAGCGTGRVAIELDRRGYEVVGVDVDRTMIDRARSDLAAQVAWIHADLATLNLRSHGVPRPFDLVLTAGNVIPLLAAGTEATVIANLAAALVPGGLFVSGFGLDAAHLPLPEAPFDLVTYDAWCASAGLVLDHRYATWQGEPFSDGGYAVSVHRSAAA